jgi:hypothetical protein
MIIAGGLLLFAAIVMAALRPARLQADNPWITQHGIVTEVYETAFKDLGLKLKGQGSTYYISRAFNRQLSFHELKEKLLYKSVVIQYPGRWSPLKGNEAKHYISMLEYDGKVIYRDSEKK